nr:hypothetical protein [Tissierella sp.]
MLEIPFIPAFLLVLLVYIIITKFYMNIANDIGDKIRKFFIALWSLAKK